MYPRIPWELVAVPLRSAEHTLGSTTFADEESLNITHLTTRVVPEVPDLTKKNIFKKMSLFLYIVSF
jgi:hypothetical protein